MSIRVTAPDHSARRIGPSTSLAIEREEQMVTHFGGPVMGPNDQPLPLALAMRVGQVVYLSGQVSTVRGVISGDGIAEQTTLVIDNIEAALAAADLSLANVFKVNVWITRQEDFGGFNAAYSSRFTAPFPVRSTVVSGLVVPGALVEMEALAVYSHNLPASA